MYIMLNTKFGGKRALPFLYIMYLFDIYSCPALLPVCEHCRQLCLLPLLQYRFNHVEYISLCFTWFCVFCLRWLNRCVIWRAHMVVVQALCMDSILVHWWI